MSAAIFEMLATIQAITNARIILVRITTPILLVLGNIGEILNIIIFVQRIFRNNSCAIYFLAASCARLFYINFAILINGLALGYDVNPSAASLAFCKINLYLSYVTAILPPSLVVLACIDRFLLSSLNKNVRTWSNPYFAYRSIVVVSIFWILFSIHAFFGSTIYHTSRYSYCSIDEGSYALFMALYSIIFLCLLPSLLMIIFGLLTIINVQRAERRVRPTIGRGYIQRKDRHLLRMLLFQVLVNVIFTIPRGAFQMYTAVSLDWKKDLVLQTWDVFFLAVALTTFYIPYCTGFYIYTLTGKIFREELNRILIQYFRRFFRQRQPRVTIVTTSVT